MTFRCIKPVQLAAFLGLIMWSSSALALPAIIDLPEQNPSTAQLELVKQLNVEFATLKGEVYFGSRKLDTWRFKTENLTPHERSEAAQKTNLLSWDQCRNTTIKLFEYPQVKYEQNFVGLDHRLALLVVTNGFAPKRIEAGLIGWQKGAWAKLSPDCSNILLAVQDRGVDLIRLSAAMAEAPKISKLALEFDSARDVFFVDNRSLLHFGFKFAELIDLSSGEKKEIDRVPDETSIDYIPSKLDELCWAKFQKFKIKGNIEIRCLNRLTKKISEPSVFKDPREKDGQIRLVLIDPRRLAVDIGNSENRKAFILSADSSAPVALGDGAVIRQSDSRLLLLQKQGLNNLVLNAYDLRSQQPAGKFWDPQANGWFQDIQDEPDHLLIKAANGYGQTFHYSFSPNEGLQFRFRYPDYQAPAKVQSIEIKDSENLPRPALLITGQNRNDFPKNAFVFVHGGGCHLNLDINQRQIVLDEMLAVAEKGFPILAITYRNDKLAPPYRSDQKPRTEVNCGTEELDDIISGYKAAKTLYPTANIFLWGMSHGGYLANVMATQDPRAKLFKGIISQAGIWGHEIGYEFDKNAKNHYSPARAPIHFIDKIEVPLFIYHGTDDRNASYPLHTEEFIKRSGVVPVRGDESAFRFYMHPKKPQSVLVVERAGHHFTEPKAFDLFVESLFDFVHQNE